jgi:hypothetical protein
MNCFKCIWAHLRRTTQCDVNAYNKRIEEEVKAHWKDNAIALKELVYERWTCGSDKIEQEEKYNYVVFIDIVGDLDWICDDDHSKQKLKPQTSALIARVHSIEATPCKHLQSQEWMSFKRILGAAIVSALEESYDDSVALMGQAKTYIEQRIPERSRLWTLWSATIGMIFCGLVFYFLRNNVFAVPFEFGILGAYVSIVRHASMRNVDSSAGKMLHVTEAAVRLLIGAILGKIGVLLCDSSLAPEFARSFCALGSGVRVIAFASGLFDAFIPAMISTYVIKPMNSKGESHD